MYVKNSLVNTRKGFEANILKIAEFCDFDGQILPRGMPFSGIPIFPDLEVLWNWGCSESDVFHVHQKQTSKQRFTCPIKGRSWCRLMSAAYAWIGGWCLQNFCSVRSRRNYPDSGVDDLINGRWLYRMIVTVSYWNRWAAGWYANEVQTPKTCRRQMALS